MPAGDPEHNETGSWECDEEETEASGQTSSSSTSWNTNASDDPCSQGPTVTCADMVNGEWEEDYLWQEAVAYCESTPSCELEIVETGVPSEPSNEIFVGPQSGPKKIAAIEAGIEQPSPARRDPEGATNVPVPITQATTTDGDPVQVASGGLFQEEVDLFFPGPVRALEFRRSYNSRSTDRSVLGSNWTHNFDVFLKFITEENIPPWLPPRFVGRSVIFHDGQGSQRLYVRTGSESYFLSPSGDGATIEKLNAGWLMVYPNGREMRFSEEGYLETDTDRFGNRFTILYEETPLYSMYRRYCTADFSSLFPREDPRVCKALAYIFEEGPREKWFTWGPVHDENLDLKTVFCDPVEEFGPQCEMYYKRDVLTGDIVSAWAVCPDEFFDEWSCANLGWSRHSGKIPHPRNTEDKTYVIEEGIVYDKVAMPNESAFGAYYATLLEEVPDLHQEDPSFPYPYQELFDGTQHLITFLDEGNIRVQFGELEAPLSYITGSSYGVYHTPENTYGSRRMRPKRVIDPLGRTLDFEYYEVNDVGTAFDPVPPSFLGLLKEVKGPADTSIEFSYKRPPGYPSRLNEVFLTQVKRIDATNNLTPGLVPSQTALGETISERSLDYIYNWPGYAKATSYDLYHHKLWKKLADFGDGSASKNASLSTLRYIESVADNIVLVLSNRGTPHERILAETRYGANPDEEETFDRVRLQRFGGTEGLHTISMPWETGYPLFKFEYIPSNPEEALGNAALALPEAILDKYPLEEVPLPILNGYEERKADVAAMIEAASGELPMAYLRAELLYFVIPSPEGNSSSVLRRTPLSCSQFGAVEYEYLAPAAQRNHPLYGLEAVRGRVRSDINRICSWTKTTDRGGNVRYRGMNYRGQTLVDVQYEPRDELYLFAEQTFNEDGLLLEERRTTRHDGNWTVADGGTQHSYCEVIDSQPASWRSRLNRIYSVDRPKGETVANFTPAAGSSMAKGQFTQTFFEPVYNQVAHLERGVVQQTGQNRDLYRINFDFADTCGPFMVAGIQTLCDEHPELCYGRTYIVQGLDDLAGVFGNGSCVQDPGRCLGDGYWRTLEELLDYGQYLSDDKRLNSLLIDLKAHRRVTAFLMRYLASRDRKRTIQDEVTTLLGQVGSYWRIEKESRRRSTSIKPTRVLLTPALKRSQQAALERRLVRAESLLSALAGISSQRGFRRRVQAASEMLSQASILDSNRNRRRVIERASSLLHEALQGSGQYLLASELEAISARLKAAKELFSDIFDHSDRRPYACGDVTLNSCGRKRPSALEMVNPNEADSVRTVRYQWGDHGLATRIEEEEGRSIEFAYHDSSYSDNIAQYHVAPPVFHFLSPDEYCRKTPHCRGEEKPSLPGGQIFHESDGRGFIAEIRQDRFPESYAELLPVPQCDSLLAPYRYAGLLCADADASSDSLGLSEELQSMLMPTSSEGGDNLLAQGIQRYRFSETGFSHLVERDGLLASFRRNQDGRIVRADFASGLRMRISHTFEGWPEQVESRDSSFSDRLLGRVRRTFDSEGRIVRECVELKDGGCSHFRDLRPADMFAEDAGLNPKFQLRLFSYTDEGLFKEHRDPDGLLNIYSYNSRGLVTAHSRYDQEMSRLQRISFAYNDDGKVQTVTQGHYEETLQEHYEYDGLNRLSRIINTRGLPCLFWHNPSGMPSKVECGHKGSEEQWVTEYGYDAHGRRSYERHNGEKEIETRYGRWGRFVQVSATGRGTSFAVLDDRGEVLWVRDALGNERIQASNAADRKGATLSLERGEDKWLLRSEVVALDKNLQSVEHVSRGFDQSGLQMLQTSSLVRNELGHVMAEVDAAGLETRYTRNLLGWPLGISQGDQQEMSMDLFYNHRGNVIRVHDPKGEDTFYDYDRFGQLEAVAYPGVEGALLHGWRYDTLGRLETRLLPGLGGIDYQYDEKGDLIGLHRSDGKVLASWQYDDFGRIKRQTDYNRGLEPFGIDRPLINQQFSYDQLGRIEKQTIQHGSGPVKEVESSWNATGSTWQREVVLPTGTSWLHQFNAAGKLDSSTGSDNEHLQYSWLGGRYNGRIQKWRPDADPLVEQVHLDPLGRRLSWIYGTVALDGQSPSNSSWAQEYCGGQYNPTLCSDPLLRIDVHRNVVGQVASALTRYGYPVLDDAHELQALKLPRPWRGYEYDEHSRLARVWEHPGSASAVDIGKLDNEAVDNDAIEALGSSYLDQGMTSWSYVRDEIGSLTEISQAGSSLNRWSLATPRSEGKRLVKVAADGKTRSVHHDSRGRVSKDDEWEYLFDARERLVGVRRDGQLQELYAYTADGKLASVFEGTELRYTLVYDAENKVGAYSSPDGTVLWEASWGPEPNQLVWWHDYENDRVMIPLLDERNSLAALWSQSGKVTSVVAYTPNGRMIVKKPSGEVSCMEEGTDSICPNPEGIPFGLTSSWRSSASGLVNMGARWYSPRLGQFLSHDPLSYLDSFNLYTYAANDPVNSWDPTGLSAESLANNGDDEAEGVFDGWFEVQPVDPNEEVKVLRTEDYWWWPSTDELVFGVVLEGVVAMSGLVGWLSSKLLSRGVDDVVELGIKSGDDIVEGTAKGADDLVEETLEAGRQGVDPGGAAGRAAASRAVQLGVEVTEHSDDVVRMIIRTENGPVAVVSQVAKEGDDLVMTGLRISSSIPEVEGGVRHGVGALLRARTQVAEQLGRIYNVRNLRIRPTMRSGSKSNPWRNSREINVRVPE